MRIIQVKDLTDDMVLGRPIFHKLGMILLNEGSSQLTRFKDKFKMMGIDYLYIEDELSKGIEIDDVVSEATRREGRRLVGELMNKLLDRKQVDMSGVQKIVGNMIEDILSNKSVIVNITDLKNMDTYLYYHAVNVSVLSLVVGSALGYAPKQLNYLGTGAILHDIGLLALPKKLAEKAEADMTEAERKAFASHPQLGYEMLKSLRDVDAFSKNIVWGHHEHVDGTGYPRKIGGAEIHEMVKIVSVCDAFDEMTSSRGGKKKAPSYQAIEYLIANIGKKFEKKIVASFVRHIAAFPVGSMVTLNDQRKGIVEKQNEGFPTRPVVRLMDASGTVSVDLLKEVNLVIVDSE